MSKALMACMIIVILAFAIFLHAVIAEGLTGKNGMELADSRATPVVKSSPTPKPTLTPSPKKTPVPRTKPKPKPKPTPRPHRYFFDYQFRGWHYFQQGPSAYKRQVLATPTPRPSPPPFMLPGVPHPETSYNPIPRVLLKKETEFSPRPPARKQIPPSPPHKKK
ncbi:hypothetical protein J7M23_05015 [Candidatus Sumerlaeota bacterium]|nr:hypothetical protein [Candidatus Sumerlaeota bacterium]